MYDRGLATRLHELTATLFDLEETRMFGGLAYMMNDHICFALWDDYLVIRIGNESASKLVETNPHARLFDLNGKTMKGWELYRYGDVIHLHIATKNRKIDIKKMRRSAD